MAYEWGRFMSWLAQGSGQNAAALQAVSALLLTVFTVALIVLTGWYAGTTGRMARTLERQLAVAFQPFIGIDFVHHFQGKGSSGGVKSEDVFNLVKVSNDSSVPIKLVSVRMFIYIDDPRFYNSETTVDQSGLILSPGKHKEFRLTVDVEEGATGVNYSRTFVGSEQESDRGPTGVIFTEAGVSLDWAG
jgi:hypothetical protein